MVYTETEIFGSGNFSLWDHALPDFIEKVGPLN
jgi:hypothetical protein